MEIKLLGRRKIPSKYMSTSSASDPSAWSPRFVPVSASRKVANAHRGSFGTTVAQDTATLTAGVAGMERERHYPQESLRCHAHSQLFEQ